MTESGITHLYVQSFKSLAAPEPYEIEVRPLTLLAGANSSGKSSAVQPLLLLKQTLEASYDPGPLLLDGPHVKFTSTEQMVPCVPKGSPSREMAFGLKTAEAEPVISFFQAESESEIRLTKMKHGSEVTSLEDAPPDSQRQLAARRVRCYFVTGPGGFFSSTPAVFAGSDIRKVIHVPGLLRNV